MALTGNDMKLTLLHACAATLAFFAAACGGSSAPAAPTPEQAAAPEAISARPDAAPCPDDGPRLPLTHLCSGRVINYVDPNIGLINDTPDGCTWSFTETAMPGGDEVIVHRVLTCEGVTTAFDFSAGAHSASLGYKASAIYAEAAKGIEPVRIFTSDPADPQKVIKDLLDALPAAEKAKCVLEPAGIDVWPGDALVLQYTKAERAKAPQDEPIMMCGEFGRDEDSANYWRIFGGYAWYFNMGQDGADFDPGSFMLFRKGPDGAYALAK